MTAYEDRYRLESREDRMIIGRLRIGEDPIPFLPRNSVIVPLLLSHIHSLYHQGVSSICAEYSHTHLTPKLRPEAKSVISRCFRCNRVDSRPFMSEEAPLQ